MRGFESSLETEERETASLARRTLIVGGGAGVEPEIRTILRRTFCSHLAIAWSASAAIEAAIGLLETTSKIGRRQVEK